MWNQVYNPFGNAVFSTIAAAIPVVTLLVLIASGKVKAHIAAIVALIVTNLIAIIVFTMPANMSIRASLLGVVAGFFPIGWIVLNVIYLYRITVATGRFEMLQRAIGGVTEDRRLQLLLIAFSFGAFFEGASGFGTPVAVTGAVLIGLGFSPLAASGLSLIANTAPVAYGALGTPIQGLMKFEITNCGTANDTPVTRMAGQTSFMPFQPANAHTTQNGTISENTGSWRPTIAPRT